MITATTIDSSVVAFDYGVKRNEQGGQVGFLLRPGQQAPVQRREQDGQRHPPEHGAGIRQQDPDEAEGNQGQEEQEDLLLQGELIHGWP
jgi:hypothetical protein